MMPFSFPEGDSSAIKIPGSKSIINRLLCMSLYHNIDLTITNINLCNDVMEMLNILSALGKEYTTEDDKLSLGCRVVGADSVRPVGVPLTPTRHFINEAGTCLRFILPYLAFLPTNHYTLHLGDRLAQRPIKPLIDCLNNAGANITMTDKTIKIKPSCLQTDILQIDSSQSSQFLSSILMFASSQTKRIRIEVKKQIISKSYIKMTEDILKVVGFRFKVEDTKVGQAYMLDKIKNKTSHIIINLDPDYSTACYYWLYSYLSNKKIIIPEITNIYQPDYQFNNLLTSIRSHEQKNIPHPLIDMSEMPDQIITLAFLALFLKKKIQITGYDTLANKESDRLAGIIENIKLLGGRSGIEDNILSIFPLKSAPKKCILKTYSDHRFALTFTVLKKLFPYIEIDDLTCIAKSL